MAPAAYLRALGSGGVWPGEVEISVMARRLNVAIVVHRRGQQPRTYGRCSRTVHLLFSDAHYDLLVPAA